MANNCFFNHFNFVFLFFFISLRFLTVSSLCFCFICTIRFIHWWNCVFFGCLSVCVVCDCFGESAGYICWLLQVDWINWCWLGAMRILFARCAQVDASIKLQKKCQLDFIFNSLIDAEAFNLNASTVCCLRDEVNAVWRSETRIFG